MTGLSRRRTRLTTPLRRLRAARAGVFWLPCPLCGDLFSGLECATMLTVAVADNPTVQQIACPNRPANRSTYGSGGSAAGPVLTAG